VIVDATLHVAVKPNDMKRAFWFDTLEYPEELMLQLGYSTPATHLDRRNIQSACRFSRELAQTTQF
jgi:hypothetical protein